MDIGTAYYPEHVDPARWPEDLRLIADMGLNRIRVGEFAWCRMEPAENQFEFDWLGQVVDLADGLGIETVLCTPTAAPPAWLVYGYPEILPVNREGRRAGFGARQHRCFNSPVYRERAAAITTELARSFGSNPAVSAWQIDNELGGEHKWCFCDCCRREFLSRLKSHFGTIDELNRRWGTVFWSQEYRTWDDVPLPNAHGCDMLMHHHPSLELEFARFSSDSIVEFAAAQARIITEHSTTNPVVSTNADSFHWGDNVHLPALFEHLDVVAMDIYTTDKAELGFYCDFARSIKGSDFWLNEYPTGHSDMVGEWALVEERACEQLLCFKFRPFPWGQEQGMENLLTSTGKPGKNYPVAKEWARRARNSDYKTPGLPQADVAILYDFDSSWTIAAYSWSWDWADRSIYPLFMIDTIYRPLFEMGKPVEFAFRGRALPPVPTIIAPRLVVHDTVLEETLLNYVEEGGTLVVTTDLFTKNNDNVHLEFLPRFYLVGMDGVLEDFARKAPPEGWMTTLGKGRILMVDKDLEVEGWSAIYRRVL